MQKQQVIPGTKSRAIREIDDAAEAYLDVRDKRQRMTEQEVEKRSALEGVMRRHKLREYRSDDAGLSVTLVGQEKAKVRRTTDEAEADE